MESHMHAFLSVIQASNFRKIWDDRDTGSKPFEGAFFRPLAPEGFFSVGDVCCGKDDGDSAVRIEYPNIASLLVREQAPPLPPGTPYVPLLATPIEFNLVWKDVGTGGSFGKCAIWEPVPPPGYIAMGFVVSPDYEKPSPYVVRCVHQSQVLPATMDNSAFVTAAASNNNNNNNNNTPFIPSGSFTWRNQGTGKDGQVACWTPLPGPGGISCGTFVAARNHQPPRRPLHCLYQASFSHYRSATSMRIESSDEKVPKVTMQSVTTTSKSLFKGLSRTLSRVTEAAKEATQEEWTTTEVESEYKSKKTSSGPCEPGYRICLKSLSSKRMLRILNDGEVDGCGGKDLYSMWDVEDRGKGRVAFRSAAFPMVYLQISEHGKVNGRGCGNKWCEFRKFKVASDHTGKSARFELADRKVAAGALGVLYNGVMKAPRDVKIGKSSHFKIKNRGATAYAYAGEKGGLGYGPDYEKRPRNKKGVTHIPRQFSGTPDDTRGVEWGERLEGIGEVVMADDD